MIQEGTVVKATLLLFIMWKFMDISEEAPSTWCPQSRFPSESGRCQLCFAYCNTDGCTGPGSHFGAGGCNSCWLGLEVNSSHIECISPFQNCRSGYYVKNINFNDREMTMCLRCNPLCTNCTGPGLFHCGSCRFFRHNGMCVRECPDRAYLRPTRGICTVNRHRPGPYLSRRRYHGGYHTR